MRHRLANLTLLSALGGCSLIYNPNNIPEPPVDASTIDMFVADADPTMLEVLDVQPSTIFEGQGTGGSREAVIVLLGHHFIDGVATVEIKDTTGAAVDVMIDPASIVVDSTRDRLAFRATVPVDTAKDEAETPLRVIVRQQGVERMIDGELTLKNLDELDAGTTDSETLKDLYSLVETTDAFMFAAAANKKRVVIRSVSSITVGDITASAAGATPGPGGFGAGSAMRGMGAGVNGTGGSSGGGAGHAMGGTPGSMNPLGGNGGGGGPMIGDKFIASYTNNHGSAGGSGGGNAGGGGGGIIELTAGGTVTAGALTANGGNAPSPPALQQGGGGGAGGVVVVRAGASADLTGAITVNAGNGAANGGNGSAGRVRIEAPTLTGPAMNSAAFYRGPSFDPTAAPTIISDNEITIRATGTTPDAYTVFVLDAAGVAKAPASLSFATPVARIDAELELGYNRVCIVPQGSMIANSESTNCIDVAYVP